MITATKNLSRSFKRRRNRCAYDLSNEAVLLLLRYLKKLLLVILRIDWTSHKNN